MEIARRELLETLEELGEGELQRFKDKLSKIQPKEGYRHLPSCDLRYSDPPALTDLLLRFYGTDYGVEVAVEALGAIDQGALAGRLVDAVRTEKHFYDRHRRQQTQPLCRSPPLPEIQALDDGQYQTIRAERTSQEKMRKLYEVVPSWNKWQKNRLYRELKETNRDLVEELEGGHFVDRHREQLIQRVTDVDKVLRGIRRQTLNPEQYESISTGGSDVEKMQKLYELVPSWGREQKDRLFDALHMRNRDLVRELDGREFEFWGAGPIHQHQPWWDRCRGTFCGAAPGAVDSTRLLG